MSVAKTVTGNGPRRFTRWATAVIGLWLIAITMGACAPKIPNIRPFASETASLYTANGDETQAVLAQYNSSIALAGEILKQSKLRLSADDSTFVEGIKDTLEMDRAMYAKSSKSFDVVLQQAVSYSEKLAELAAAGESGNAAATSLANTISEFGNLAGAGSVITAPIEAILTKVAAYYTQVQAAKTLREAVTEAQDAVSEVATALKQIYAGAADDDRSGALERLVSSLASNREEMLLFEAGTNIMGYYIEANDRRDMFYLLAKRNLQRNTDGLSGFCRNPESGEVDEACITLLEMEALREVEERLAALKPEWESYQEKRAALRSWHERRRANGARIVKAVDAWVKEHRAVGDALEDGTGVSAWSLRAILAEIEPLY